MRQQRRTIANQTVRRKPWKGRRYTGATPHKDLSCEEQKAEKGVEMRRLRKARQAAVLLAMVVAVLALGLGPADKTAETNLQVPIWQQVPGPYVSVCVWKGDVCVGTQRSVFRCNKDGSATAIEGINGTILCYYNDGSDLLIGVGGNTPGLYRLDGKNEQAITQVMRNRTASCVEKTEAGLWIGTRSGLYVIKGENELKVASKPILCIAKNEDTVFAGTSTGIDKYAAADGKELGKVSDDQFSGTSCSCLFVYRQVVWCSLGTLSDKNNPGKLYRKRLDSDEHKTLSYSTTGVVFRIVRVNDRLWIAAEKGLFKLDLDEGGKPTSENNSEEKELVDTKLTRDKVMDLWRDGDTLWGASETSVLKLKGMNGGPWEPRIAFTRKPMLFQFSGSDAIVRWSISDYGERTTPDLVNTATRLVPDDAYEFKTGNTTLTGTREHEVSIESLSPGIHCFHIEATDLNGSVAKGPSVYVLAVPALVAAAVFALFLFYIIYLLRRWLRIRLGLAEWRFESDGREEVIRINDRVGGKASMELLSTREETLPMKWPPDANDLSYVKKRMKGKVVVVEVPEHLFDVPIANWIRGLLYNQPDPTIAGQLCLRELRVTGADENWMQDVTFAGLACLASPHRNERAGEHALSFDNRPGDDGSWYDELKQGWRRKMWPVWLSRRGDPRSLVDVVSHTFSMWGATVAPMDKDSETKASSVDFVRALTRADVVHVLAHGRATELVFQDRCLNTNELETVLNQLDGKIRCRLLVLSACEAGALQQGFGTFVFPLVRRGIQVIAASTFVDYPVFIRFFTKFYSTLFPNLRSDGVPISQAVRKAVAACYDASTSRREYFWGPGIDSLVLYTDPSVRFRLRWKFPRWISWTWARLRRT